MGRSERQECADATNRIVVCSSLDNDACPEVVSEDIRLDERVERRTVPKAHAGVPVIRNGIAGSRNGPAHHRAFSILSDPHAASACISQGVHSVRSDTDVVSLNLVSIGSGSKDGDTGDTVSGDDISFLGCQSSNDVVRSSSKHLNSISGVPKCRAAVFVRSDEVPYDLVAIGS